MAPDMYIYICIKCICIQYVYIYIYVYRQNSYSSSSESARTRERSGRGIFLASFLGCKERNKAYEKLLAKKATEYIRTIPAGGGGPATTPIGGANTFK